MPRPGGIVAARAMGGLVPLQWILPWSRGGWLLILTLLTLASWQRDTWSHWWHVPAIVAAIMAVHMLTVSSYRFSVPTLPLALLSVSGPIVRVARAIWQRSNARAAAAFALLFVIVMQWESSPFVYELQLNDLDGFAIVDRRDEATGATTRFASAAGGSRPVLLLTDEVLPGGPCSG